jgi:nodulation protein Z
MAYAPDVDHLQAPDVDRLEIMPGGLDELGARGPAELPRYLVLSTYHGLDRMSSGDPGADHYRLRRVYRSLALRPEVQAAVDGFYDERLAETFVVGVNIATGNMPPPEGPYYFGRFDTRVFRDRDRFLARVDRAVEAAIRRLPPAVRERRTVFYATDSAWMSELLGRLRRSHTRRTVFPPANAGRLYADYAALGYSDVTASFDMVVDHFLLGRADALVFNGSMFNNYARVVTDYCSGNIRDIESMYGRWWLKAGASRVRRRLRR